MCCEKCAAEIPADGKFCIECGTPVTQAATGRYSGRNLDIRHSSAGSYQLVVARDHGAGRPKRDPGRNFTQRRVTRQNLSHHLVTLSPHRLRLPHPARLPSANSR